MAIIHELQQNGGGLLIWSQAEEHLIQPADSLALFHAHPFSVLLPSVCFLYALLVFPSPGIRPAARQHRSLRCSRGDKDLYRGALPRCVQMSVGAIYERRLATCWNYTVALIFGSWSCSKAGFPPPSLPCHTPVVTGARLASACAYEVVLEGRPGVILNFDLFKAFPNKMPSFTDNENNALGLRHPQVTESWGNAFGGHYHKRIPTLKENDVFS